MATYPVKLLIDKNGTAFIPVVNSDSIIAPDGDTLDDLLDEKQDTLVSGTNLKTINNQSLLGSGNITIEGGGTVNTYYLVNILNMTSTSDATYEIVNDLINNNQFVIFDDPDGRSRELFCYVPIKTYYQSDLDIQTFWYIDNQDKYNLVVITHSGTSVTVIRTTYHSIEEAYNLADGKQNALVSGTNIKTINNESILGSGNITISGGGGGSSTDVQINGVSITNNDIANIMTNTAYNANTNKIATMTDVSNAVASKLDANWNADDSNGFIEWQEGESSTASKLITKVVSNTNNNFSQTEITSDNMLLTSGVNGAQMNTSINMTPYAINITNQTTDGSITIDADLITLSGAAQIATVPDTNNSIVNKKYVDDIVGDIESLLGGI